MRYLFFGGTFNRYAEDIPSDDIERHDYDGEPRHIVDLYEPRGTIVRYFLCSVRAGHRDWPDAKIQLKAFFAEGTSDKELDELARDALAVIGLSPQAVGHWEVLVGFTAP